MGDRESAKLSSQSWAFLSRALSNVESTLDKVLDAPSREQAVPRRPTSRNATSRVQTPRPQSRVSVQDRLAAAVSGNTTPENRKLQESYRVVESVLTQASSSPESSRPEKQDSNEDDVEQVLEWLVEQVAGDDVHKESVSVVQNASTKHSEGYGPVEQDDNTLLRARIQSLEAKLQAMFEETVDRSSGAYAKQLAERDEQIASLTSEGERMARTELKHMNLIKSLRAKTQQLESSLQASNKRMEKLDLELVNTKEKLHAANILEKRQAERIKKLTKSETDLVAVRNENEALKISINKLEVDFATLSSRVDDEALLQQKKQLDMETARSRSLETELSRIKASFSKQVNQLEYSLSEAKSKIENISQKAAEKELSLNKDIEMLEMNIETWRARVEESSISGVSDSQTRLLHQLDAVQTRHAAESEAWQRIEMSLQSKVQLLENERSEWNDSMQQSKQYVGELQMKIKKLDNERKNMANLQHQLNESLSSAKHQCDSLRDQLNQEKINLEQIRRERANEQQSFEERVAAGVQQQIAQRVQSDFTYQEEESAIQTDDHPVEFFPLPDSPAVRPRDERAIPAPGTFSRNPSMHSIGTFDNGEPPSQFVHSTIEDISVSDTVSAGLNVQVMERMSANIRRLESQMASARDELVRITSQRDEARAEIVELLRGAKERTALQQKVASLSNELQNITAKHDATLVMLGEKSELVEELQADVQDVKEMYRELVESQCSKP